MRTVDPNPEPPPLPAADDRPSPPPAPPPLAAPGAYPPRRWPIVALVHRGHRHRSRGRHCGDGLRHGVGVLDCRHPGCPRVVRGAPSRSTRRSRTDRSRLRARRRRRRHALRAGEAMILEAWAAALGREGQGRSGGRPLPIGDRTRASERRRSTRWRRSSSRRRATDAAMRTTRARSSGCRKSPSSPRPRRPAIAGGPAAPDRPGRGGGLLVTAGRATDAVTILDASCHRALGTRRRERQTASSHRHCWPPERRTLPRISTARHSRTCSSW